MLGAIVPVWIVATFLCMLARVDGNSMNPTLHDGDLLLLYKLPRWLHVWSGNHDDWPRRGDIIVFKGPANQPESYETTMFGLKHRPYLIKRVVGLAGDTIEIRGGWLYRDGRRVAESTTTGEAGQDEAQVVVPEGHVYVLGDNRRLGESVDSRYFGFVAYRDVAGVIGPKLWSAPP